MEGTLEECLGEITFALSHILDEQYQAELKQQGKDLEPESFLAELTKRRNQILEDITSACLKKGEYKSELWQMFSEYSKQECQEIKASGHSNFF
jgi:hypothetical protein